MKRMLAICGAAASLTVAGVVTTAVASQYSNQNRTQEQERRTSADQQLPDLFQQMQGAWEVDVRINAAKWQTMKTQQKSAKQRDADRDRNDTHTDSIGNDAIDHDQNRTTRDRDQGRTDRDRDRDRNKDGAKVADKDGFITLEAIATAQPVLGGSILRERMMITDGAMSGSDRNRNLRERTTDRDSMQDRDRNQDRNWDRDQDRDRNTQRNSTSSGNLEGLCGISYFAFDQDTENYTVIFMNSTDGTIHHDTGEYDAGNKQIVFKGESDDANSGPKDQNLRVVLKQHSRDKYQVTMYVGDEKSGSANRTTGTNRHTNRTATANRSSDKSWMHDGNIVYQATYTRADNNAAREIVARLDSDERTTGVFASPEHQYSPVRDESDRNRRDRDDERESLRR